MEYMELLIVGTPPHLSDMDEEEVMQQDGDPEQGVLLYRVQYVQTVGCCWVIKPLARLTQSVWQSFI